MLRTTLSSCKSASRRPMRTFWQRPTITAVSRSTLKNSLDHFWQEFTDKLFAQVGCSLEKGLTVIDQLLTVARQCYSLTLPYGYHLLARLI